MDGEARKEVVRRAIDESFNKGNLGEELDEWVADDYQEHLPTPHGAVIDRDSYKGAIRALRAGFPDIEFKVEEIVAEGDELVAARNVWTGTHTGPFAGVQPTGRRVTVTAMGFNRVRDGKIVEHWGQIDMLGLLAQIGAVQMPGGPPGGGPPGGPPGGGPPRGGPPGGGPPGGGPPGGGPPGGGPPGGGPPAGGPPGERS